MVLYVYDRKKLKGYIVQFVIFLILYLMMFGVGISIIFKDKPLLALTWITLILMFVFFFHILFWNESYL